MKESKLSDLAAFGEPGHAAQGLRPAPFRPRSVFKRCTRPSYGAESLTAADDLLRIGQIYVTQGESARRLVRCTRAGRCG